MLMETLHPCFWHIFSLALEYLREISIAFGYQEIAYNLVNQKKKLSVRAIPPFPSGTDPEAALRHFFPLRSFSYL